MQEKLILKIVHTTFSMTLSISEILIQVKSRYMKNQTKLLLFTKLDMWQSNDVATQKLIVQSLYNLLSIKQLATLKESNRNKYLKIVPTNESKNTLKKYEELCTKIRVFIGSINNSSYDCDEKYMKIKFNLIRYLSENAKTLLHSNSCWVKKARNIIYKLFLMNV